MKHFKALSKRGLALLVALLLCIAMLPTGALAAEEEQQPTDPMTGTTQEGGENGEPKPSAFSAEFEQYDGKMKGTLTINGTGALTKEIADEFTISWVDAIGNPHRDKLFGQNGSAYCTLGMIGKLVIGEGITEIGTSLFDNDENRALNAVREIVFPESLVTIGDYAFSGCGMESLTFPSSLQHIGEGSFLGCQHLTSVSFTGSGAEIGPMAFFQCSNLQTLNIDGVSKIDKYAFQECDAIKTLTLKNVETIGEGAFFWCQGLETLTLENVGLVDEYAFQKCISLETVSLKNVETISMCAFFQCGGLETLTLENVGLVDEYAFQQCTSLETVSMENVETVGQDAFFQCYELKHADLTNVGTLMGFVFEQTALESATMNKVGTINRNAFYECSSLTNVTGLDTVERIDGFAFFGCSSLKGLTVADATKMGFNGDNDTDVMERVEAILNGQFELDAATQITELQPEAGWDDHKVARSENWNTYNNGTQLMTQAKWADSSASLAEVKVDAYYTAQQQMDYIFVVDLSASMAQLGNTEDQNARFYDMQSKMLDMTNQLLTAPGYDCQVAFVTFGGAVMYSNGNVAPAVSETIPFTSDAEKAAQSIKGIVPMDQNTDYGLGLKKTLELAKTNSRRNTAVIFMSDGQPVSDGNETLTPETLPEYLEKIAQQSEEIETLGINIYGVLHSVSANEHDGAVNAMKAVCSDKLFFEASNTEEFSQSVNAAMSEANGGNYTVTVPVGADFENVTNIQTSASSGEAVLNEDGSAITWTITGMPFTKHTLTFNAAPKGYGTLAVTGTTEMKAGEAGIQADALHLTRTEPAPEATPTPRPIIPPPVVIPPDEPIVDPDVPLGPGPEEPDEPIEDPDVPLAPGLNADDHVHYIIGMPDGTVQPLKNITRAEVATIFYRLMTDENREANWATTHSYPDAGLSSWYTCTLATTSKAGYVRDNQNGEAMPNKNITRAEFATIVARFLGTTQVDPDLNFTDIKGHWAEQDILRAASANWMQGYSSKFRPNDYITRAEVATTINRMTGRRPKEDVEMEGMIHWPDNADPAAWYYEAIQEATNDHDYEREDVSDVEEWTEITHDVDWLALEKLWIAYNGATGPKD